MRKLFQFEYTRKKFSLKILKSLLAVAVASINYTVMTEYNILCLKKIDNRN